MGTRNLRRDTGTGDVTRRMASRQSEVSVLDCWLFSFAEFSAMSELEANQRAAVVATAMTWLRTPYHHQAGVKGAGCDCAFLLVRVFAECGLIPDIDPRPYPPDWHLHRDEERYLGWIARYARRVERALPGDVALWRFGRTVSHAGIVVEWPTIIHAYRGEGVVLENAARGRLAEPGRLHGFFSVFSAAPVVASEPDSREDE